ncbi:uncharacterized protein G2W53_022891 [Senna tora]|uniref:Uncharacterized protein n=1 Tax=Senna tora TaxID=362788 RepID=A0A834TNI9_9FABA|nr:uncharacterized protein G2W53_022891 [Senna tora]
MAKGCRLQFPKVAVQLGKASE